MISAFGIDHGDDVSKAFSLKRGFALTSKERALRAANGPSKARFDQRMSSRLNDVERAVVARRAQKYGGGKKGFGQAAAEVSRIK